MALQYPGVDSMCVFFYVIINATKSLKRRVVGLKFSSMDKMVFSSAVASWIRGSWILESR